MKMKGIKVMSSVTKKEFFFKRLLKVYCDQDFFKNKAIKGQEGY